MSHSAPEGVAGTADPTGEGAGQPQGEGQDQSQGAPGTEGGTPGTGEGDGGEGQSPEDLASQLAHWKAQARKHETRAKANAQAATRLKALEDKDKTELQLAQERAAEAERERDDARMTHARIMAAATHDLPVDLIDDLGAGTAEEIDERAQRFAGVIETRAMEIARQTVQAMGLQWPGTGQPGSAPTAAGAAAIAGMAGRPVESLVAGATPGNGGPPTSKEGVFRGMLTDPYSQ